MSEGESLLQALFSNDIPLVTELVTTKLKGKLNTLIGEKKLAGLHICAIKVSLFKDQDNQNNNKSAKFVK